MDGGGCVVSEQELNVQIGDRLRRLRIAAKVSIRKAAETIGVVNAIISNIETGQQRVTLWRLRTLAELYGAKDWVVLDDEHWEGVNSD